MFFNVDGMWRVAEMSILDLDSGRVTKIHDSLPQPGTPTWSPDGKRIALAGIAPMTVRFREGTNQVQTISAATGGDVKWYAPIPMLSIDSRGGGGPVWSPDGTKMAAIYEGVLSVWPVAASGEPQGPPRRVTTESAHAPSWQGDSRHILYQSLDQLRIVDIETGETKTVPLNLTWTPAIPKTRTVIHAGRLLDMKSAAPRDQRRHHRGRQPDRLGGAARGGQPCQGGGGRCLEPDGDAGPGRVPLAPAEGLRRRAGPRLAGLRRDHGAQSGQYARTKRWRIARRTRPACGPARASTAPAT